MSPCCCHYWKAATVFYPLAFMEIVDSEFWSSHLGGKYFIHRVIFFSQISSFLPVFILVCVSAAPHATCPFAPMTTKHLSTGREDFLFVYLLLSISPKWHPTKFPSGFVISIVRRHHVINHGVGLLLLELIYSSYHTFRGSET